MKKIGPISGFPEWLPEQKIVEQKFIEVIRGIYESFGFVPIETPAVELLETLFAKGGNEKEIYALTRAQEEGEKKAELGLHFDLTVPFARYVAQHLNDLVFPFKRYQIQKVWRGERPQFGRSREFYQFDADIVGREQLPLSSEAELLEAFAKVYEALPVGNFHFRFNSRALLHAVYDEFKIEQESRPAVTRAIDKLDKIGEEAVLEEIAREGKIDAALARDLLSKTQQAKGPLETFDKQLDAFDCSGESFQKAREDLQMICSMLPEETACHMHFDGSLARGLDYYSGIIVEVHLEDFPELGSVGGGGRYDGLVSQFVRYEVPGVGFSVGLTRIMEALIAKDQLPKSRQSVADVLIAIPSQDCFGVAQDIARDLRSRGLRIELYPKAVKLGKQIEYANKKGVPFVLFPNTDSDLFDVKDLASGDQETVHDREVFAQRILGAQVD